MRKALIPVGLFAGAALLVGVATTSAESETVRPDVPYSADSFFRSTVTGAPVDAGLTASFRTFMNTFPDQKNSRVPGAPILRGIAGNAWGTAYAEGHPGDQKWRFITGSKVLPGSGYLITEGITVSDSVASVITGTSDSPLLIRDYVGQRSVLATKVRVVSATDRTLKMEGGSAGTFYWSSNGLDAANPRTNDKRNKGSRGRIPDAMAIRRDMMAWSVENKSDLGHVLHLFMVETDSSKGKVHPMTGFESGKYGWGAEGVRIAIRPDLNIEALSATPEAKVILRTLQRYGAIIGDNAGSGTAIKLGIDGKPWSGLTERSLAVVTWNDFVVIQPGWQ